MSTDQAEKECWQAVDRASAALHEALARAQDAGYGDQLMAALSEVINGLAAVEEMAP
jgi:diacylglycerol kinase